MEKLVDVVAVEVTGKHRLCLTFADGTEGEIQFDSSNWNGVLDPLRDPDYFARVSVDPEAGTVVWPNGADMAPEPLYDEVRRNLAA